MKFTHCISQDAVWLSKGVKDKDYNILHTDLNVKLFFPVGPDMRDKCSINYTCFWKL